MKQGFIALLSGVLILVIGLVLASTIISSAVTAGTTTSIGSFSGAQSINDLMPLLYYAGLAVSSLGLMGIGGAGVAGRGPLGRGRG